MRVIIEDESIDEDFVEFIRCARTVLIPGADGRPGITDPIWILILTNFVDWWWIELRKPLIVFQNRVRLGKDVGLCDG